jgi:hypothetical protein
LCGILWVLCQRDASPCCIQKYARSACANH